MLVTALHKPEQKNQHHGLIDQGHAYMDPFRRRLFSSSVQYKFVLGNRIENPGYGKGSLFTTQYRSQPRRVGRCYSLIFGLKKLVSCVHNSPVCSPLWHPLSFLRTSSTSRTLTRMAKSSYEVLCSPGCRMPDAEASKVVSSCWADY